MFSREWEQAFAAGTHLSVWPWSDLVSHVHRFAPPGRGFRRVLEVGCGVGANIPFFRSLGVEYFALEGSPSAVERLLALHPDMAERIAVADFTSDLVFPGPFDLVVDRSAIAHNTVEAVHRCLGMIFAHLRPGGRYIGIDWFSTSHAGAGFGDELDAHTRRSATSGPLAGLGAVQFVDQDHLTKLLSAAGFVVDQLEHKVTEVLVPPGGGKLAWWHVVATKP